MKKREYITRTIFVALLMGTTISSAQTVNNWRGSEAGANWTDNIKWQRGHAPSGDEAAYFREPINIIRINSTIQLNNGMHLYGEELSLQGNGNLNLWNPVPHARTVNIPASASGFANMTLNDNISLNGRVALSAKGFGTSASKGSLTLKDRSNVTGALCIGNAGKGTGQVFVKDNSIYRITALELATEAASGGSAQIHVIGGTVRIESKENPFNVFLQDSSRKLILGDSGTIRFEFNMPVSEKKDAIKSMILQSRLTAAPGCRLLTPIIQDKMMIIRAEDERNDSTVKTQEQLFAAIDQITSSTSAIAGSKPQNLESLLKSMNSGPATKGIQPPTSTAVTTPSSTQAKTHLAGYIVFFGGALLVLRRPNNTKES